MALHLDLQSNVNSSLSFFGRVKSGKTSRASGCQEDFRIEGCRVLAGMRSSCTLIEDDGLWFEGTDGSHLFVSIPIGRDWVVLPSSSVAKPPEAFATHLR